MVLMWHCSGLEDKMEDSCCLANGLSHCSSTCSSGGLLSGLSPEFVFDIKGELMSTTNLDEHTQP